MGWVTPKLLKHITMQKYSIFIGIDMSKQWFDAALYWPGLKGKQPQKQFENGPAGFEHLLKWVGQQSGQYRRPGQWYACMEHTGIYGLALAYFLKGNQTTAVMECPLRISRSLGLRRGKTDAADARAIARYAQKEHLNITVRPLPSPLLLQVQTLLSLRNRLMRYEQGLKVAANELRRCVEPSIAGPVLEHTQFVSQPIQQRLKLLDKQAKNLLCSEPQLKNLYKLISSVVGVGPVITAYVLVYTNGFTAFRKARQFACYIGVAPFPYQSGTSIRQPDKVSYLANKRIKTLISTAVTVALNYDPEYKAFFKKHKALGKDNGWIYNALKNKMVHRIFAVVKRGTPYVVLDKHQA